MISLCVRWNYPCNPCVTHKALWVKHASCIADDIFSARNTDDGSIPFHESSLPWDAVRRGREQYRPSPQPLFLCLTGIMGTMCRVQTNKTLLLRHQLDFDAVTLQRSEQVNLHSRGLWQMLQFRRDVITRRYGQRINSCIQLSRYSDWLRAGRPWDRSSSPGRGKSFLFSTYSRPALGPTQPPIPVWTRNIPNVSQQCYQLRHLPP
jgi:hypothetical protein